VIGRDPTYIRGMLPLSLKPCLGGPLVLTHVHLPCSIAAQNGAAGRLELKLWIGHAAGGQPMLSRFRLGQQGFVPQA
jgi:hypothetical protein